MAVRAILPGAFPIPPEIVATTLRHAGGVTTTLASLLGVRLGSIHSGSFPLLFTWSARRGSSRNRRRQATLEGNSSPLELGLIEGFLPVSDGSLQPAIQPAIRAIRVSRIKPLIVSNIVLERSHLLDLSQEKIAKSDLSGFLLHSLGEFIPLELKALNSMKIITKLIFSGNRYLKSGEVPSSVDTLKGAFGL